MLRDGVADHKHLDRLFSRQIRFFQELDRADVKRFVRICGITSAKREQTDTLQHIAVVEFFVLRQINEYLGIITAIAGRDREIVIIDCLLVLFVVKILCRNTHFLVRNRRLDADADIIQIRGLDIQRTVDNLRLAYCAARPEAGLAVGGRRNLERAVIGGKLGRAARNETGYTIFEIVAKIWSSGS